MAANQHGRDFKTAMRMKYKQPVDKVLKYFVEQDFTYSEVAELTGFKMATIRKYSRRYKIYLRTSKIGNLDYISQQDKLLNNIRKYEVDSKNFLYKAWCRQ
ncbi:hypothetical protein [Cysteiniphilum sp. QT6929]|uniref:hypothetical protein n=1 Tax=Cysteiniphilum sp. QT6929 TaxID=2975055 RepID=UPI0024B398D5|nr:hypothetical protein [Cysteiniphilum sp. QT6929]WHN66255.1 hypothetical protein NYP54_03225 [Cysteiniphilum sp. QT6929]